MKMEIIKKLISVISIAVVIVVVVCAFICREQVEKFALSGYMGVLIACFASTATILLPAPGILVVLEYAQFLNPILVVILGGIGTALGELLGYLLGRAGKEISNLNTKNAFFIFFNKKPYLAVFLFSALPLPVFDVIGIASGMTKLNVVKFWSICFAGKVIKLSAYVVLFTYAKDIFDL